MADLSISSGAKPGKKRAAQGEAKRYYREVVLPYEGDECLIWPFGTIRGYGTFSRPGESKRLTSRILCEDVYGPPPTREHEAAHGCGNGHLGCVAKKHLRWATSKDNHKDMVAQGNSLRGSKNPSAKLTEEIVRHTRSISAPNLDQLARKYGVTRSTLRDAINRKSWTWL